MTSNEKKVTIRYEYPRPSAKILSYPIIAFILTLLFSESEKVRTMSAWGLIIISVGYLSYFAVMLVIFAMNPSLREKVIIDYDDSPAEDQ